MMGHQIQKATKGHTVCESFSETDIAILLH